jgi:GGDEF domain-containing protein
VLPGLTAPTDAADVVDRVRGCFAEPFRLEGRQVPVTCSVGMAVTGRTAGSAEVLMRAADAEMYRVKRSTDRRVRVG